MNKPAIAAFCLSLVSWRRGPPGPGSVLRPDAWRGRAGAQHRGFHGRRQGLRRGQARPGRGRPGRDCLLRADRRRDRQVSRCQAAGSRRVRRAQARQRHRRRTRPPGRPEGADAEPLLLRLPAQYANQDRGAAHAEAGRQGRRISARWTRKGCCNWSAGCSTSPRTPAPRSVGKTTYNPYYCYRWNMMQSRRAGAVCPRRFRQGPGRSLREGDRRCADAGRAAGAV